MAKNDPRCTCCGMKVEAVAGGICADCNEGRHAIHCSAKAATPAPAAEASDEVVDPDEAQALAAERVAPLTDIVADAAAATALAPAELPGIAAPAKLAAALVPGPRGVAVSSFDQLWRMAQIVSRSGFAPKGMDTPESCAMAIQLGLELGLTPISALSNIAVINNKPGVYGDAALALVRASGLCEYVTETLEGEGDSRKAVCISKRKGDPEPLRSEFSVVDAKRAGLWAKGGPWTQYPERMLRFRARGFNLRDNFPDVLKGVRTVEELGDYIDVTPAPAADPIAFPRRKSEVAAS